MQGTDGRNLIIDPPRNPGPPRFLVWKVDDTEATDHCYGRHLEVPQKNVYQVQRKCTTLVLKLEEGLYTINNIQYQLSLYLSTEWCAVRLVGPLF